MKKMIIAAALAALSVPAMATAQEPTSAAAGQTMLWRDIYLGEPKADINARYPEMKTNAKGKMKRYAFHRPDETFVREKLVLRRDDNGNPICETRQIEVKYDAEGRANKVMLGFFQDCSFETLVDTMVSKYGTDAKTVDGTTWYSSYKQALYDNGLTLIPSAAIWQVGELQITMTSPDILKMMYITYEPVRYDTIDKNAF